jgi:MFS family permease
VISLFLKDIPRSQRAHSDHQTAAIVKTMRTRRFVKTIYLTVVFYALINVYYAFLSVLLYGEGISIPIIGVLLTVALLPAVALEVPMGNAVDRFGVRKTLTVSALFTTIAAILIPLPSSVIPYANNLYYTMGVLIAFTVSYTMIFIVLYSRMSDTLGENKVAMTGAIAAFKDVGYTLGPLIAGFLMGFMSINMTFLLTGIAFILLVPVALTLHD